MSNITSELKKVTTQLIQKGARTGTKWGVKVFVPRYQSIYSGFWCEKFVGYNWIEPGVVIAGYDSNNLPKIYPSIKEFWGTKKEAKRLQALIEDNLPEAQRLYPNIIPPDQLTFIGVRHGQI